MCFHGSKSLTVNHHFSMFVVHWSSSNREVMYLVCQSTSQDQVIEGPSSSLSGNSSFCAHTLPSFVAREIVVVEIIWANIDIAI